MRVNIIIATYNAMPWLRSCLDSTKGYPVVVVDNASQDETVSFIKSNYPNINLLPQNENLGFGQANNIGIKYALKQGAQCVFLLNQDAYIVGNALEQLINTQQKHPEYGILSPIHTNGSGNRLDFNFSNYVSIANSPDFYSDFVLQKPIKEVYEVPFVNAAGWLISKKCLETVGGFDPLFFHYGEDDNYCHRAHFHGLKVGVVTGVYLRHDREERKFKTPEFGSQAYFEHLEKNEKLKFANINHDRTAYLKIKTQKLFQFSLKSVIKLNFTQAKTYYKHALLLKRLSDKIMISRTACSKAGPTYL